MQANLSGKRTPAGNQEPARRRDAHEARLWHIGIALAVSFTVAVAGLAVLAWLAWVLLGSAGFRRHGALSLHDTVGVLQLVFASVAGAGALVALIVSYRRQKIAEADAAHDRTRVFNERFTAIATQLGDPQPAVRLAGVHAMAGLADDWKANRQTCINVLCAYLRLPVELPGEEPDTAKPLTYRADQEVRHTVIRVITEHLRDGAEVSWQGHDLDFTGVAFDGGHFEEARFSSGTVSFRESSFSGGRASFREAAFCGAHVSFRGAKFISGRVTFGKAQFASGRVNFGHTQFLSGTVNFAEAEFLDGTVDFGDAAFAGSAVSFRGAKFRGAEVTFAKATFSGGEVDFRTPESQAQADSELATDWSHPPSFDWEGPPPAAVKLPAETEATPA